MLILGVNGWFERGHDASACLVENGKLLFAVEEEKLIRDKHAYDQLPTHSIACCLDSQGLSVNDLDYIAVGWNMPKLYQIHSKPCPFKNDQEFNDILLPKEEFDRTKIIPIVFFDHHLAHAASSFRVSGFDEAMILVLDGQGENLSGSVWRAKNAQIHPVEIFPTEVSLGYLYEAVSSYIGFDESHAGKTMGLAGYSQTKNDLDYFNLSNNGYSLKEEFKASLGYGTIDEQEQIYQYWLNKLIKDFGPPNQPRYKFSAERGKLKPETQIGPREEKIACLAQNELEKIIFHLIQQYLPRLNTKNLCLAGGVALNCTCNGKISQSGLIDGLFIQPAAYDSGVAIGAALELSTLNGFSQKQRMLIANIGPGYSDTTIQQILDNLGITYNELDNISETTAQLLSANKIIAWFQDRTEIGPRALGSRSILADPRVKETHKRVNVIKGRELWRPLAPSILEDKTSWMFGRGIYSPFMLLGLPTKPIIRPFVEAVIHVDGSTRPQTVSSSQARYSELIKAFEQITGAPAILNTSFNVPGEPIVSTPYEAIKTFYERPIDALVMGNCLIRKR